MGALCADGCEDPSADEDDPQTTLDYFGSVGSALGNAIRGYNAADAIAAIASAAFTHSSYRSGIRDIKKAILGVLPHASRVCELEYTPRETQVGRGGRRGWGFSSMFSLLFQPCPPSPLNPRLPATLLPLTM